MSLANKIIIIIAFNITILAIGTGFAYLTASKSSQQVIDIIGNEVNPILISQQLEQQSTKLMMLTISDISSGQALASDRRLSAHKAKVVELISKLEQLEKNEQQGKSSPET